MTINMVTMPLDANGHDLPASGEVWVHEYGEITTRSWEWRRCASCGDAPHSEITDRIRILEPCPYPQGIVSVVEVAFPSGKIIVTDDLRPVFDHGDREDMADYNSALGQHQVILNMAQQGCAYGPVRNTDPNLYRLAAAGQLIIASPAYDDEGEEQGFKESVYHGAEAIASVCTGLWAYSIADYELWKSRGGDPDKLRWCDTVVDITPGIYRFTHHTGERGFDWGADELIFAHIERIG